MEPFTLVESGYLVLAASDDLDAGAITRLFLSIFESRFNVRLLSFMIDGHHVNYVHRLIDVLPEVQAGFTLDEEDVVALRAVGELFPSIWPTIAQPLPMITTHRIDQPTVTGGHADAADRASFWEAVETAIERDYADLRVQVSSTTISELPNSRSRLKRSLNRSPGRSAPQSTPNCGQGCDSSPTTPWEWTGLYM